MNGFCTSGIAASPSASTTPMPLHDRICAHSRETDLRQVRNPPRGTVLMLSSSADHFSDLRGHSYERSYDGIWGTGGGFDGTGAATPVERRSEAGDYAWDAVPTRLDGLRQKRWRSRKA